MVGSQPAMSDIKRLPANILGVPAMEEILQTAGLNPFVRTSANDSELFAANRRRVWRSLRDTFHTNVHYDNILIEPLGQDENLVQILPVSGETMRDSYSSSRPVGFDDSGSTWMSPCCWGEVRRRIIKEYGRWAPYLLLIML